MENFSNVSDNRSDIYETEAQFSYIDLLYVTFYYTL